MNYTCSATREYREIRAIEYGTGKVKKGVYGSARIWPVSEQALLALSGT